MNKEDLIAFEQEVAALFTYDKKLGVLRWRKDRVAPLRNHVSIKAKKGDIAGWVNDSGYRIIMFGGKKHRATKLIWLLRYHKLPEFEIDHRNGLRCDDRLSNLREATSHQNKCNTKLRSDNASGYKGVCWSKQQGKWRATIKTDKKQVHLGFYDDVKQAAKAYQLAAPKYHGEFARLK